MIDITNQKFDRLLALEPIKINNKTYWKCLCDCGNVCYYSCGNLRSGNNRSCGCLRNFHGESKNRIYNIWCNMKERCKNKNNPCYKNYGGRGIKICDEWDKNFKNFKKWSLENGYNDSLTIDRIDVDGDYQPSNCRWVNMKIQGNNTRRNHKLTYKGIIKTMSEWSNELNISYTTLRKRLNDGWSIEDAFEKPLVKSNIRDSYDKSFTFEDRDIMYFNTKYGKFSNPSICKFLNIDKSTINKYIISHLDKNATQVLDRYLLKHNKTIEDFIEWLNCQ